MVIWWPKQPLNGGPNHHQTTQNWHFPKCGHIAPLLNEKPKLSKIHLISKFYFMPQGQNAAIITTNKGWGCQKRNKNEISLNIIIWSLFWTITLSITKFIQFQGFLSWLWVIWPPNGGQDHQKTTETCNFY